MGKIKEVKPKSGSEIHVKISKEKLVGPVCVWGGGGGGGGLLHGHQGWGLWQSYKN